MDIGNTTTTAATDMCFLTANAALNPPLQWKLDDLDEVK